MRKSPELMKNWKVPIPATVAGKVELTLLDPLTRQPRYGARTRLLTSLLEHWLDHSAGKPPDECTPMLTIEQLRSF